MLHNKTKELEAYEAERDINSDMMYCQEYGVTGEKGQCGKDCEHYIPRNGKSGNCKHNRHTYSIGNKIAIKL